MTVEKVDIELKVADMVSGLGLYGEEATKVTRKATDQAWSHLSMSPNSMPDLVLANPGIFIRNAIQDLRVGHFKENDLGNGRKKTVFVRGFR